MGDLGDVLIFSIFLSVAFAAVQDRQSKDSGNIISTMYTSHVSLPEFSLSIVGHNFFLIQYCILQNQKHSSLSEVKMIVKVGFLLQMRPHAETLAIDQIYQQEHYLTDLPVTKTEKANAFKKLEVPKDLVWFVKSRVSVFFSHYQIKTNTRIKYYIYFILL